MYNNEFQKRESQNVEERIIHAAIKLFSQKGYNGTSIRDIAKEVNITSATLYYYMDNKSDLLELIMRRYLVDLINKANEVLETYAHKSYSEQLFLLAKIHIENYRHHKYSALVVHTETRALEGEFRTRIKNLMNDYVNIWAELLVKGIKAGVFECENVKLAAYGLLSICTGVANWYDPNGRLSISEIADLYAALMLKMVQNGSIISEDAINMMNSCYEGN